MSDDAMNMEILPPEKKGRSMTFGIKSFKIQPLDEEGNPTGEVLEMTSSEHIPSPDDPPKVFVLEDLLRMKEQMERIRRAATLYYVVNQFVPERNADGEVVYFKIPTSTFALEDERDRILYPLEIYILNPKNLHLLQRRATEVNFVLEEWDWGKTELRPTIPSMDDRRGI